MRFKILAFEANLVSLGDKVARGKLFASPALGILSLRPFHIIAEISEANRNRLRFREKLKNEGLSEWQIEWELRRLQKIELNNWIFENQLENYIPIQPVDGIDPNEIY